MSTEPGSLEYCSISQSGLGCSTVLIKVVINDMSWLSWAWWGLEGLKGLDTGQWTALRRDCGPWGAWGLMVRRPGDLRSLRYLQGVDVGLGFPGSIGVVQGAWRILLKEDLPRKKNHHSERILKQFSLP